MKLKISDIQKYLEYVNKKIDQENYFSVEGINYIHTLNNFHQVLKPKTYAVITNLNPNSQILINDYHQIVKEVSEINTLSFLPARDLIMNTFSTELYFRELQN